MLSSLILMLARLYLVFVAVRDNLEVQLLELRRILLQVSQE